MEITITQENEEKLRVYHAENDDTDMHDIVNDALKKFLAENG